MLIPEVDGLGREERLLQSLLLTLAFTLWTDKSPLEESLLHTHMLANTSPVWLSVSGSKGLQGWVS